MPEKGRVYEAIVSTQEMIGIVLRLIEYFEDN